MTHRSAGIDELRQAAPRGPASAPGVSGWTVGMHIHHCTLAMTGICRALAASSLPAPPAGLNIARTVVMISGRIPRGRAKSPQEAVPPDVVDEAELSSLLDESERLVGKTHTLEPDRWFRHFAFGVLRRDLSLKLIRIHNRHHLRIIRQILAG